MTLSQTVNLSRRVGESEPEPEPVTQPTPRRCSARLAALAPAAPSGPPVPLDCEDPVMLRQLKEFCEFYANTNFKTVYNQLQRRLVRPRQRRNPILMPVFEDPSNQALLAKLQELGNINLRGDANTIDAHSMQLAVAMQQHYSNPGSDERVVKLYAKAARARLGWSGEEAQLFIKMACGYGINTQSSELQAVNLDKGHVADLIKEANKHRRLLGMKQQGPQPQLPAAAAAAQVQQAAAAHAVGLPHIGKGIAEPREFVFDPATQTGVGIDPGVTQAVSAASGVWDPATGQLIADQLAQWKLTKSQLKHDSGLNNARRDTERWLAPIKPHLQHLAAASSAGTFLVANLKHITVTLATWDAVWEVYLDPKWARQRLRLYGAQDRALEQFFKKRSSQAATPAGASEPGHSTPPPAKRSKRTKAEQAAEPTEPIEGRGKAQGKAAKAKPAPQPGRWVNRDCNAALNMQRIGESRWRPLELCYWPDQGALPAKGKEYPGLGYKRLRDKPLKAQEQQQQQQPAVAQ
ncbi:hypothetical protein QJQ45_009556 [Haematococcus lacustris]|nr:hypothetical protein QJQ45_009556 [Haematococcus lacustris]